METCPTTGIQQQPDLQSETIYETPIQCPGLSACILNRAGIVTNDEAARFALCQKENAQTQQNQ